ncbi:MAG: zinc dependent phospholipase family protein [Dehalococcoidia bacterium]|nr:zinc dependent phospholipase family protein [Dehalococcoidia bacterium]
MPNLGTHLGIAKEAASRLRHPTVDMYPGALLLGSVSPDIRIITRGKRDDTHFAPITLQRVGEGLESLFHLHPNLSRAATLTEPTRAFIVGYVSHLFADELWIMEVYRPFFGNREVFQDSIRGDLMDRALQMELDRREQLALGGLEALRSLLAEADKGVEVGFIPSATLCEWRQWLEDALGRGFEWDRLRYMSRLLNPEDDPQLRSQVEEMVKDFLDDLPQSLERIYQMVPQERVRAFRERTVEDSLKFAEEYLK